jgi:putative toxin-antitoxin system antitoxin component (TIGR02293 family)
MTEAVGTPTAAADPIDDVINLLGGADVFPSRPEGALAAHRLIEEGLPSGALTYLLDNIGLLADDPALQQALGISMRTVQRKKDSQAVLSILQSGRTWKFAEVLAKATDVFGSQEAAERWMDEPAMGLEGYKPIELMSTPAGMDVVETFLGRLSYGVYA